MINLQGAFTVPIYNLFVLSCTNWTHSNMHRVLWVCGNTILQRTLYLVMSALCHPPVYSVCLSVHLSVCLTVCVCLRRMGACWYHTASTSPHTTPPTPQEQCMGPSLSPLIAAAVPHHIILRNVNESKDEKVCEKAEIHTQNFNIHGNLLR